MSVSKTANQRDIITTSTLAAKIQQLDEELSHTKQRLHLKEVEEAQLTSKVQLAFAAREEAQAEVGALKASVEQWTEKFKSTCVLHDLQLQEQERKANDRLEQRLREEKARADDRVNDVLTELHAALTELQEVKESLEQHTLEKSALTVQLESVLAAKAQVTLDLQNTRITLEKVNKDLVVSY